MNEIKIASIDDGKDLNDRLPTDGHLTPQNRFANANELLYATGTCPTQKTCHSPKACVTAPRCTETKPTKRWTEPSRSPSGSNAPAATAGHHAPHWAVQKPALCHCTP